MCEREGERTGEKDRETGRESKREGEYFILVRQLQRYRLADRPDCGKNVKIIFNNISIISSNNEFYRISSFGLILAHSSRRRCCCVTPESPVLFLALVST